MAIEISQNVSLKGNRYDCERDVSGSFVGFFIIHTDSNSPYTCGEESKARDKSRIGANRPLVERDSKVATSGVGVWRGA